MLVGIPTDKAVYGAATAFGATMPRLNPRCLRRAFCITGLGCYLGSMLTITTVSRDWAVTFFNSLLHGLNVAANLKTSVPPAQVVLGLVTIFVPGWFAGVLTVGFYSLSLRMWKTTAEVA